MGLWKLKIPGLGEFCMKLASPVLTRAGGKRCWAIGVRFLRSLDISRSAREPIVEVNRSATARTTFRAGGVWPNRSVDSGYFRWRSFRNDSASVRRATAVDVDCPEDCRFVRETRSVVLDLFVRLLEPIIAAWLWRIHGARVRRAGAALCRCSRAARRCLGWAASGTVSFRRLNIRACSLESLTYGRGNQFGFHSFLRARCKQRPIEFSLTPTTWLIS